MYICFVRKVVNNFADFYNFEHLKLFRYIVIVNTRKRNPQILLN